MILTLKNFNFQLFKKANNLKFITWFIPAFTNGIDGSFKGTTGLDRINA